MPTFSKLQSEIGGPILTSHHDDQTNDIRNLASSVATINQNLTGYAPVAHTQDISTINGLLATLAAKLTAANNLNDLTNIPLARINLGLEKFTPIGNANYQILNSDKVVGTNVAFTAPRTVTLPAANSVNPGASLRIVDLIGTVSATNTLTVACSGSDTINGQATHAFQASRADLHVISDGVGSWGYDVQGLSRGGTGATTAAQARTNLGVTTAANGSYTGTSTFETVYTGGLSAQFPLNLNLIESTHATSRRVTMNVGSGWQILQDTAGSGTKDFNLFNVNTNSSVFSINPSTNAISPGGDNLIAFGSSTNRLSSVVSRALVARDPTTPMQSLHNTSGGTDSKIWDQTAGTTAVSFRLANDAINSYTTWLTCTRSGMTATAVSVGGASFSPLTDNTATLGGASFRWSSIYAGSATINTSDATQKSEFRPYTDVELDAIGEVIEAGGIFQWLSAMNEKGDDKARLHCGYTAQSLRSALLSRDLDPSKYAAFCADPVTRVVKKKRTIQRQVTHDVQVKQTVIVIEDGQPVQKTTTVTEQEPVFESKPVLDEHGKVVLGPSIDSESPRLPLMYPVPVMEAFEEEYSETEVVDGKLQLGLRYDLVTAWALAYFLRENKRLRSDVESLKEVKNV